MNSAQCLLSHPQQLQTIMENNSQPKYGFSAFASLVQELGDTTKNNEKIAALQAYFKSASDKDKVWVIAIFSGRRPKRMVTSTQLQAWCAATVELPEWLFSECYHTVGDLAETIALLLPPPLEIGSTTLQTLFDYLATFLLLGKAEESEKKEFILSCWHHLDTAERFVFNKLITGGFRIGVSQNMLVQSLIDVLQIPSATIAHRISGNWDPAKTDWATLFADPTNGMDDSKPYPFYLAYPVEDKWATLGSPDLWQVEWKWDGIRGQIIKRNNQLFVWSRGEELITDKFPEFSSLLELLPNGTVLDGEIICLENRPNEVATFTTLPFALLQTRISRKTISKQQLAAAPVGFIAYDLLELDSIDCRHLPMKERRQTLESLWKSRDLNKSIAFYLSPTINATTWEELVAIRLQARLVGSEGLMLKRVDSPYQVGRKVGDWWKWKIDPFVIDAVLIYAQKGHGRRSNLYTDYTFAVKDGDRLVTVAKAYSGLTDKEFVQVDAFVKANSIEKFGPVRTVKPELVFEIAFEGIAASNRHKSGVALRFPRMNRWRTDKKASDINTLADLKQMIAAYH